MLPLSTMLGAFPVGDWQFWVATGTAALAAAWLAWKLLPIPIFKRWKRGRRSKRATLTIEGEKPTRPSDRRTDA